MKMLLRPKPCLNVQTSSFDRARHYYTKRGYTRNNLPLKHSISYNFFVRYQTWVQFFKDMKTLNPHYVYCFRVENSTKVGIMGQQIFTWWSVFRNTLQRQLLAKCCSRQWNHLIILMIRNDNDELFKWLLDNQMRPMHVPLTQKLLKMLINECQTVNS